MLWIFQPISLSDDVDDETLAAKAIAAINDMAPHYM